MYNALVVPYFDYCSPVWGCIGKCQFERLQKLQNRAARIITNSHYMTPSSCLLHDLGWDTLEERRTKQLAITMHKVVNDHFPFRLHNLFQTTSQVHTDNLRGSAHNLFIPRPLSEAGKRSLHYRGATLWNSLSTTSKTQTNVTAFKESLLHTARWKSIFYMKLIPCINKAYGCMYSLISSRKKSQPIF